MNFGSSTKLDQQYGRTVCIWTIVTHTHNMDIGQYNMTNTNKQVQQILNVVQIKNSDFVDSMANKQYNPASIRTKKWIRFAEYYTHSMHFGQIDK